MATTTKGPQRMEEQPFLIKTFEREGRRLLLGDFLCVSAIRGDWLWADGEADVIVGLDRSTDSVLLDIYDCCDTTITAGLSRQEAATLYAQLGEFLGVSNGSD